MNTTVADYSIDPDSLVLVIDSAVRQWGLASHHTDSMNDFYKVGISEVIMKNFQIAIDLINERDHTQEDRDIARYAVNVVVNNVTMEKPKTLEYTTGKDKDLYPRMALLHDKTYSATIYVDIEATAVAYLKNGTQKAKPPVKIQGFRICKIPIMVGTVLCNLYGKSDEALRQLGEDPTNREGFFIVNGIDYLIDNVENILFNQPKIYRNVGFNKSLARCEFISKGGDGYQNSDMLIIRYSNDNTLTIEISRDKLSKIQLPFYVIFRALGWNTDKQITENIAYGIFKENPSDIDVNIDNLLNQCFEAKYQDFEKLRSRYDQFDVLKGIVDSLPKDIFQYLELEQNPDNYQNAINSILKIFDVHMLPHRGMQPENRHDKLRFLAMLVRKTFMVYLQYIEPTDRDSYINKRIHTSGPNYTKQFKTYYNQTFVMPIRRKIIKELKNNSFSQIDLQNAITSSVYAEDMERLMVQTLTSGNRAQLNINKSRKVTNRLSSQLAPHKNQLSLISGLRQITSSTNSTDQAKQSERANEMRRVHMTFLGYVCVVHTPEGEKVGVNKQMAISSTLCKASSSEVLKDMLYQDSMLIHLKNIPPYALDKYKLSNVYVNGDWIGCTHETMELIDKYRKLRRQLKIDPHTTIHWDNLQDEVYFWVDIGRLIRPLLIVYNNKRDPEAFLSDKNLYKKTKHLAPTEANRRKQLDEIREQPFIQGIALTQHHIKQLYKGELMIDDLVKMQICEYIAPEEQTNYYLCSSFRKLAEEARDELKEYTHCDIPQSQLGITGLTSPFANHNQATRLSYQTSHSKQTCGYYALNHVHRIDKEAFLQYICETPLVRTLSNNYMHPNGCNVIVALTTFLGYNIEDSIVISKAAVERGLYNGSKYTFYKSEIDTKEEIGISDVTTTTDLKTANYSKLVDGVVKRGDIIEKGDVIIGKYIKLPRSKDQDYMYADRSVVYNEYEPSVVHNVVVSRNEDDEKFVKVGLRKVRLPEVGDKFSSRAG